MSDVFNDLFGGSSKATGKEAAALRLQAAKESEVRRADARENRRRASTAKTLTASRRGGSLFPSDFASSGSLSLG